MANISSALEAGIEYGFIDSSIIAEDSYKPALLVNDFTKGEKVLTSIISELENCDEFLFSVAFITEGGLATLIETLKNVKTKNIHGKIIASQYQNFTQPKALYRLLHDFDNIELRIVINESQMHTKGYIFKRQEEYVAIIGSSNLTQDALCQNKEWNIKVISNKDGSLAQNTLAEFYKLFDIATPVTDEFLEQYSIIYNNQRHFEKLSREEAEEYEIASEIFDFGRIKPNKMQTAALKNLQEIRSKGLDRALLISATGTGKTYLAAFDVASVKPERCLFIIHREQIAKDAMQSFAKVMGHKEQMAILSGSNKDLTKPFLFSTIQTLSKDSILQKYSPNDFDYIIIDEVHRAGAPSYQKVLQYFKPKFLLGMTATPERSDDFDIFKLFNYNIAYEIRLQDAMAEKMICPFHYYGITELAVDGEVFDDHTEFRHLVSDQRADHIIQEAKFYGFDGPRVKGLIFCSRNEEAAELSRLFNERGLRTIALSGANSQEEREDAVRRLEQDDGNDSLDYIFTVDIFNEGIDIPAINQIIMLRPTQSAIIFVQQLGRGLRLYDDKDFVIIIDFIGNYTKNFLIPIALSGDRTYNKDSVRKYVSGGNSIIPGCSTISFDEITKQRIYESIDAANFNDIKLIKEAYKQLKYKIGHIPSLMDFDTYGEIDPQRIFDSSSLGSYYMFLSKYEEEYHPRFDKEQTEVLEYLSKKLGSGKRPHELIVIRNILDKPFAPQFKLLEEELSEKYSVKLDTHTRTNVKNMLSANFLTGSGAKSYQHCVFLRPFGNDYVASEAFMKMLKSSAFRHEVSELLTFALSRCDNDYKFATDKYADTNFVLYRKYTYEDACRLLNWEKGLVPLNIGGYKYDKPTQTYPVFINYDKAEDISDTTKYEDRFTSPTHLIAISKSGRTISSDDVYTAVHADELGVKMELFVRKNKDDAISKEFYYLGRMHATGKTAEFTMPNTTKSAVEIEYELEVPIREDLYRYITD